MLSETSSNSRNANFFTNISWAIEIFFNYIVILKLKIPSRWISSQTTSEVGAKSHLDYLSKAWSKNSPITKYLEAFISN